MNQCKTGLVYVARVLVRRDFAIGQRCSWNGEFYPWRGVFTGFTLNNLDRKVVYDQNRPAVSYGWKVGFTTNIRVRTISLIGVCGALEFVALARGHRHDESSAHAELKQRGAHLLPEGPAGYHQYGCSREWYRDSDQFVAWLSEFKADWRGLIAYKSHSGMTVPRVLADIESHLIGASNRVASEVL